MQIEVAIASRSAEEGPHCPLAIGCDKTCGFASRRRDCLHEQANSLVGKAVHKKLSCWIITDLDDKGAAVSKAGKAFKHVDAAASRHELRRRPALFKDPIECLGVN